MDKKPSEGNGTWAVFDRNKFNSPVSFYEALQIYFRWYGRDDDLLPVELIMQANKAATKLLMINPELPDPPILGLDCGPLGLTEMER